MQRFLSCWRGALTITPTPTNLADRLGCSSPFLLVSALPPRLPPSSPSSASVGPPSPAAALALLLPALLDAEARPPAVRVMGGQKSVELHVGCDRKLQSEKGRSVKGNAGGRGHNQISAMCRP